MLVAFLSQLFLVTCFGFMYPSSQNPRRPQKWHHVMTACSRPPAVHFWWHGAPLLLPPAEAKPVNGAISTPGNPVRHVHVRLLRLWSTNGVGPLFVSLPNNFLLRNTGRHNYDTLSPIFSFNLLTDLKHWKMLSPNLIPLFPNQLYF